MDLLSLEGQTFGPKPMRVCVEKVKEFVEVTDDDPDRWAEAAPPGYLAAALFVVAPELLAKLDGFSVIHGEQSFAWANPIEMESDVLVSGHVSKIRERGGSFFVGFDMTATAADLEIASGTSLFLVAETSDGAAVEEAAEPPALDRGSPAEGQRSASRSDLVRYAAATRDWNPIHWDHHAALGAGVPGVITHGLLQAAWALEAASRNVETPRPFDSARIRFRSPLRPARPVDIVVEDGEGERKVIVSDDESQYLLARVQLANG